MAFWRRIIQSKLKQVTTHHIERCCLQASAGSSRHYRAPASLAGVKASPLAVIRETGNLGFASNVRFFAAPVQAKPKEEEWEPSGPRLNEQIKAREVRVVTDEGHYIVPFYQVLQEAKSRKLDVVEVDRIANPPVVKIMDYHMEKYKQRLQEKERAKSKGKMALKTGVCKEVRFTVKTEAKDLAVKADGIKRLMDRGYRVKCMATGNEGQDLGSLLAQMFALIEDVSHVESGPRVEKRQAFVIVRHVKFGSKGKKKVDVSAEIEQQKAAMASGDTIPEEEDLHVLGSKKTEEENSHGEDEKPGKVGIAWPMNNAGDDSTKMLDPRSKYSRGSPSDFQRPAQAQADRVPAQQVSENRYARKTDQGRRLPPQNSVDNNNWGWDSRDSFRSDPCERARMPTGTPRQDRPYPNFPGNSSAPPGEMQRPDGPSPRDAGNFRIFSSPRNNASNNQR